jgi:ribosomal protein L40E
MNERVFHGNLTPEDLANALHAAFNHSNLYVQTVGSGDKLAVQIASRPNARSGGKTALTIHIRKVTDGVHVQIGKQAWMGIAASLGQTAFAALRNPLSLLNRLDDIAQDIENLQLDDDVWEVITQAAHAAGASHELSEKLKRLTCEYCNTANPVGAGNCIACGAPLGDVQPKTCLACGYVLTDEASVCPNCGEKI